MNPENMPHERISHKRPHTVLFHCYEISRLGKSGGTENRLEVASDEVRFDRE